MVGVWLACAICVLGDSFTHSNTDFVIDSNGIHVLSDVYQHTASKHVFDSADSLIRSAVGFSTFLEVSSSLPVPSNSIPHHTKSERLASKSQVIDPLSCHCQFVPLDGGGSPALPAQANKALEEAETSEQLAAVRQEPAKTTKGNPALDESQLPMFRRQMRSRITQNSTLAVTSEPAEVTEAAAAAMALNA
ncbi:hypothetical protein AAMO2058_001337000 [Amorphochlora amoebiformis]